MSARQHNLINVYLVLKNRFLCFLWEFCILFSLKWKSTIHLGWMYQKSVRHIYVQTTKCFCTHKWMRFGVDNFVYIHLYRLGCFHSTVMNFQHKTKTDLALVPSSQLDKTIKRAVYVTKTTKTKWITMLTVNLLLLWDIAQYTKMYIWHIT